MAGRKKSTDNDNVAKTQKAKANEVKKAEEIEEQIAEVKETALVVVGTEKHNLCKDRQLTLCVPQDVVKVTVKNTGGGDVLVKAPIEAKIYAGDQFDIDSNENIILYSHSFPVVLITYWR